MAESSAGPAASHSVAASAGAVGESSARDTKRVRLALACFDKEYNITCDREDLRSEYVSDHKLRVYDHNDPHLSGFVEGALRDSRLRLIEILPYCTDEGMPWVEAYHPSQLKCVLQFLVGMFSVWCGCAVGLESGDDSGEIAIDETPDESGFNHNVDIGLGGGVDFDGTSPVEDEPPTAINHNGRWTAVKLYAPHRISGNSTAARLSTAMMYRDTHNKLVYHVSSFDIHTLIQEFVRTLTQLRMFEPTSVIYTVPPELYPDIVSGIERALLGDGQKTEVALHGNIFVDDRDDRERFCINSVGHPMKTRWGIGTGLLRVPKPLDRAEWVAKVLPPSQKKDESASEYAIRRQERIEESKHWLPQIHFSSTLDGEEHNVPPYIAECRHFDLDAEKQVRFEEFIRVVNGTIHLFRNYIEETSTGDDGIDDDALQQWICDHVWDVMHAFTPALASFVGAQYCQRTCIKFQNACYCDDVNPAGIGKPRSYYPADPRYQKDVSPEERRVVGGFLDTAGMAIFSKQTFMCGFVGYPGAGKSLASKILVLLVGDPYVMRLDKKHNNWSMSMFNDVFMVVTEDQSSRKMDVTSDIRDGLLGSERNSEDTINIQTKYKNETKKTVRSIGGVMCRNAPPDEIIESVTLSPIEKLLAACLGTDGGDCRRAKAAPPLMVQLNFGTANPIDEEGNRAFNEENLKKGKNSELPFVLALLWMVTTMGEVARDSMYGLVGDDGNEVFDTLLKQYLSMGKDKASDVCALLLQNATQPTTVIVHKTADMTRAAHITMQPSVPFKQLLQRFFTESKSKLKHLPSHYGEKTKAPHCPRCGMCFTGIRRVGLVDTVDAVVSDPKCTNPDKNRLTRICPVVAAEGGAPVRCVDILVFGNVITGYEFRPASVL